MGRIVFSSFAGPVAVPVNFRILDGDVVFRTSPLSSVNSVVAQGPVSFEVDHIDEALAEGWSVLLRGRAHEVVDQDELEQVKDLGVSPWAGGTRDLYIRLTPQQVTGRRIRQSDAILS